MLRIDRSQLLSPRPVSSCIQLRRYGLTRGLRQNPISLRTKLGLSLASSLLGLGLVTVGFSWSQLNLDSSHDPTPTRDSPRKQQPHIYDDVGPYARSDNFNMRVRHPSIYMKTSEQTAFPGENTGVMRYDTAQLGSTRNHVTDFAAAVLPVPSGYWSIFALLSSAEDHRPANHGAVSWIRRNIVAAIAGALADAHNSNRPPPNSHVDHALCQALARLDDDAQTGMPWARYAGHTSTLLAFFDSETRVLRIANTGAGRAFLGRRVGNDYECEEIAGSGTAQYFEPERSRVIEVDELVDEGVFPLRSSLDASSVEVQSVEIRDGDFLVLGSDSTWVGLSGNEAVQAVSAWMREQEAPPPPKAPGRSRRWPQDPFQDFPWEWKDHEDGRLSWVRAMIPAMIWDVDDMFMAAARENPASRILQRTVTEHRGESRRIAPERDHNMSVCPEHSVSNRDSQRNGGSAMVVVFADAQAASSKR